MATAQTASRWADWSAMAYACGSMHDHSMKMLCKHLYRLWLRVRVIGSGRISKQVGQLVVERCRLTMPHLHFLQHGSVELNMVEVVVWG